MNIFGFSLIIEGATEKVLQLIVPQKSMYDKMFVSVNNNNVFDLTRAASQWYNTCLGVSRSRV